MRPRPLGRGRFVFVRLSRTRRVISRTGSCQPPIARQPCARRSSMNVPGYRDHPIEPWDRIAPADPGEAEDFLRRCYAENPRLGPVEPRLAIVRAQIAATGTY